LAALGDEGTLGDARRWRRPLGGHCVEDDSGSGDMVVDGRNAAG